MRWGSGISASCVHSVIHQLQALCKATEFIVMCKAPCCLQGLSEREESAQTKGRGREGETQGDMGAQEECWELAPEGN